MQCVGHILSTTGLKGATPPCLLPNLQEFAVLELTCQHKFSSGIALQKQVESKKHK